MTLQERIDAPPTDSGPGYLVAAHEGAARVPYGHDCRIYGEGSPWWGPARIERLELGQARVTLERLTVQDLWLRNCYLSTVRDVLVAHGRCWIGHDVSDDPTLWPSALTLDALHVYRAPLTVRCVNVVWTGGSVERTGADQEITTVNEHGTILLQGVRFEDDVSRTLHIGGPAPVILLGCHFTMVSVEIHRDAHPDTRLVGCTHTQSVVRDRRRDTSRPWWRFW